MARIKRFGILKMALFMGLYGAIIGLIAALLIAITLTIFIGSLPEQQSALVSIFGVGVWLNVIFFPLGYGIIGFVAGVILTPIMNLILKIIKGLDLDIEVPGIPNVRQPVQQPMQPSVGPYY
jgi:hypothetical protein